MRCVTDKEYGLIKSYAISRMKRSLDPRHNHRHVIRVKNNALKIVRILGAEDKVDKNLLRVICLIHDLTYTIRKPSIYTYIFEGRIERRIVREVLKRFDLAKDCIELIADTVFHHTHSYPFRVLNRKRGIF